MTKHWVYDVETLTNCFVGVFHSYEGDTIKIFVVHNLKNDFEEFISFLEECKKEQHWFYGYNNIAFDAQVIEHILLTKDKYLKMSAEQIAGGIYEYAQSVIDRSNKGEWLDYPEWKLSIKQVDIFKLNHWDNEAKRTSLKWVQYGIDWYNVEEMPHPHYKDVVGIDSLKQIISYCVNDVKSTRAIFLDENMKKQMALRAKLSEEYKLNLYSASEPKISKEMFIHFLSKKLKCDSKTIRTLRTLRDQVSVRGLILPYVKFSTPEFCNTLAWFKNLHIRITEGKIVGPKHVMKHKDVETVYALGGIHGCTKPGIYSSNEDWVIMTADVTSFYPNLAIRNKWSPEHIPKDDFCELYEWFFEERKKYSKKDPLNYLFKIILNSTYGLSKSVGSFLYDPELTFRITVNGQLLLSMLYEMISLGIPQSIPLMQNTDGLEFMIPRDQVDKYHQICKEWETMTSLQLELETYQKMIIRDVNNYIAIYESGAVKCKGAFEWQDLPLHKNKSFLVIPKALYQYFVHGVQPEEYLKTNRNIFDYCGGVKIKGNWFFIERSMQNGKLVEKKLQKLVRYYVSEKGVKLIKCHTDGREIQIESGLWLQQVFNRFVDKPFEEYGLNMKYYLEQIQQEIENIEGVKTHQLRLF